MPKYIKLEELAGKQRNTAYPWDEWRKIPLGSAVEVPVPDGRKVGSIYSSLIGSRRFHVEGLRVIMRNGRIYVLREKVGE